MGPQPPRAHLGTPPKMPLLVEWTFIMDWHKLEKTPFGIGEYRHRGREARTQWGAGEAWPGCRKPGSLPSPHTCADPLRAHEHAFVRLDLKRILVRGPIGTFIFVCLSICLSICVWGGDEWRTGGGFCSMSQTLTSHLNSQSQQPRTSSRQDDRACLKGGEQV